MAAEPEPHTDWVRHSIRINAIIDNQVRSLRKRQVIDAFESGVRKGTYWGIRTDIADYDLPDALPCPLEATTALANFPDPAEGGRRPARRSGSSTGATPCATARFAATWTAAPRAGSFSRTQGSGVG